MAQANGGTRRGSPGHRRLTAWTEIVQVAKDQQADLIVIGRRGLAGKTRSFLGSTASQVVTYSPCSVLVVKTQD